jgi:tetratricopeptide (TPR) repeat protein
MRGIRLVVTTMLFTSSLAAQEPTPGAPLGIVRFENSCNAAAQPVFNRGVALLHSFEFRDAIEAFNQTLTADPKCGIAYWGLALSIWSNPFVNARRAEPLLDRGLAVVEQGRTVAAGTQRERDFLAAVALLYDDFRQVDQVARLSSYRNAMGLVAARYPDDIEAAIFYALSMAISADPADKTFSVQLEAGRLLENLFARYPEHPGLAHYIIHTYDVPSIAGRAQHAAQRYAKIAPAAPHALHMPSHTFTRVGAWLESINSNLASAAAAKRAGSTSEELHASDYLMYAYLQAGQDSAAAALVEELPAMVARFDPAKPTGAAPVSAAYFAIAAIPARYALERAKWAEAVQLAPTRSPFAWVDAVTLFARALGAARIGDTRTARGQLAALTVVRDRLAVEREAYWQEQTEIQLLAAAAWIALAEGKSDEAVTQMREAAAREDATEKSAVTPGPLAPARELLGEMLLHLNRPAEALAEFQQALLHEPNRSRTLAGAARARSAARGR